ncbi:MAG TPA: hypothetical protein VI685_11180, partial [Candidatus Angelobacter sp.]
YLILAVCSVLPLILFLYAADRLLRRITTRNLMQTSQQAADLTGKVLEEKLTEVRTSLEAIAGNPATVNAWARGDLRTITNELQEAHALWRETAFFAIL